MDYLDQRDLIFVGTFGILISFGGVILHEILQFYINFIATGGNYRVCPGRSLPFDIYWTSSGIPVVHTCLAYGGIPVWNALLSVLGTILVGFGVMWKSRYIMDQKYQWTLALGGGFIWLWYSLYLGAFVGTRDMTAGVPEEILHNGVVILENFGSVGILLSLISLILGSFVLITTVQNILSQNHIHIN